MDIGTAKPRPEVRARIPHRMIDVAEPSDEFTVREFQALGREALDEVAAAGGRVVICGGSGLHFRALVDPMTFAPTDPDVRARLESLDPAVARARLVAADPDAGDHVDLDNPRRVVRALEIVELTDVTPTVRSQSAESRALAAYESVTPFVAIGIDAPEGIGIRIERRFDAMLDEGLLAEVAGLRDELGPTASQAVGYKELLPVVAGDRSLAEGRSEVLRATNALVKRQRTFFRRDPRIAWQPWQDDVERRIDSAIMTIGEATSWTS